MRRAGVPGATPVVRRFALEEETVKRSGIEAVPTNLPQQREVLRASVGEPPMVRTTASRPPQTLVVRGYTQSELMIVYQQGVSLGVGLSERMRGSDS